MAPRVFVAMPISEETDELWKVGIRDAVESLGWECRRADRRSDPGPIVSQIHDDIAAADVVIAEVSAANPNVFYEIGFAHALGKPTILLARSASDLKAFDLRGYRHVLHADKLSKVREGVQEALSELANLGLHEPVIPQGEVVYEWPSDHLSPPRFLWVSHHETSGQIDEAGGQSFQVLHPWGDVIAITNTDELWNHARGWSIMWLGNRAQAFCCGDRAYLVLVVKANGDTQFEFGGDGGYVEVGGSRSWAACWPEVSRLVRGGPVWSNQMFAATVKPTRPGYNPADRGTQLYLRSSVRRASAHIRRIRGVRVPAAHV